MYRFQADWLISSVAWSNEPGESFQLAVSSYIENYSNRVQLVQLAKDDDGEEIKNLHTFEHPYPATKVLWVPKSVDSKCSLPRLLATTADYLRLWRVGTSISKPSASSLFTSGGGGGGALVECETLSQEERTITDVKLECLLNSNKGVKHCAPLTSFDWNDTDPTMIVTSSVDTTCAIWDIEMGKLMDQTTVMSESSIGINHKQDPINNNNHDETNDSVSCNIRSQIVAHNHEVYDVSFSRSGSGRDVFVSAGGDGSVRLFDLRRLSTSIVLYEADRATPSDRKALVRVCCNKQDPNFVSAFAINSRDLLIMDVRNPSRPVVKLSSHLGNLNSMSWAPHSAHHLCSASDDHQALIWELSKLPNPIDEPLLAYRSNGRINVASWSATHPDWIAIGFENYLELLRV